jgi:phosphatidylglycerophosphatase A
VSRLILGLATLGPVGYSPVAPASAASAVTVTIGWFLPAPPLLPTLVLLAVGTLVAVWVAGEAERKLGHDAHPIVADEVLGQSVALLGAPHTPLAFAAAFALFRLFDVWKPFGIRQAQSLRGGLGVVADDVLAGLVACAALHLGAWGLRAAG